MSSLSPDAAGSSGFQSLLVVRLSAMGDTIHTLPAVVALRQAFPHITLGWLIEERWAELLCTLRYPRAGRRSAERPLIDRVHTVNMGQFRRSPVSFNTWQQMAVGLSELRGVEYDAAVDFQGGVALSEEGDVLVHDAAGHAYEFGLGSLTEFGYF